MDDVISVLNQFGYFAFAVSGTLAVSRRRLDLFGALVMAIVTAVGGGTLRDLLLGSGSVYWVDDPTPIVTATIGGVFAIAMLRRQPRVKRALPVADALGLAVFSVMGAEQAQILGASAPIAMVMGVLTAIAGGIIRDTLSGTVPLILQRELYASAAVLGSASFVLLEQIGAGRTLAILIGIALATGLRLVSMRWNYSLPCFEVDEAVA